jgi:glycosyltransferase involved in cell wall biosynthesis
MGAPYSTRAVRVAFLTQDLQLSGGVGVVVEHASQLARRHGFDVSLVLTQSQAEPDWSFRGLEHLHVLGLEEAARHRYDVALSTWWETSDALFDLDAQRHASFVQSLEERFYPPEEQAERMAAAFSLDLPVRFVTEARWIARALEALQPGNRALLVRNGIAKDVFVSPAQLTARVRGPLRVLVEGSPRIAFKGVAEALAATGAMQAQRHVTLVTPERDGEVPAGADEVVRAVPHAQMAALYAQADVVLKLSRIEGMFGPPLEGMHLGATCVVTPVTGHEEYVRHGVNGLIVDWDDPRGTARALDLLATDRALLHELRCGALATARAWPSWEQAGAVMALALRRIAAEPPPDPRATGRRLTRDFQANLAFAQRNLIDHRITTELLLDIQSQRAWRWGVAIRTFVLRLAWPVRRVLQVVRGRRGG